MSVTQYPWHEKSFLELIDPTGLRHDESAILKVGRSEFEFHIIDDLGPLPACFFQPADPANGLPARLTDIQTGAQGTR